MPAAAIRSAMRCSSGVMVILLAVGCRAPSETAMRVASSLRCHDGAQLITWRLENRTTRVQQVTASIEENGAMAATATLFPFARWELPQSMAGDWRGWARLWVKTIDPQGWVEETTGSLRLPGQCGASRVSLNIDQGGSR